MAQSATLPHTVPGLALAILGLALAVALASDLFRQKIPNWVTLPSLSLALLSRLWQGRLGPVAGDGLSSGLAGLGIALFAFLPALYLGGLKGGDVKLMAAVGAAVGFPTVLYCLLATALLGGLEALLYLLARGKLGPTLSALFGVAGHALGLSPARPQPVKEAIPYGVAIALGTAGGLVWARLSFGLSVSA